MRLRPTTYILTTAILLLLLAPAPVYALGMVKLIVKVFNEEGLPLEGAQVRLAFQGGMLAKDRTVNNTDSNGYFSSSGFSDDGVIVGGVYKDGYYTSVFHHDFVQKQLGIWQPWGKEFTVIMRPIVNPVPMFVRNKFFEIPELDKEVGFDLMRADWVAPYGQGVRPDFIFKAEQSYNNISDFSATVTLTFANQNDGIQIYREDPGGDFNVGSSYRLPRTAPVDGYQAKWSNNLSTSSPDYYALKAGDENYFFRVRSEVDHEGKLKQAMYGKIRGEISISPYKNKPMKIKLHYFLNPDHTRNLEFDPKRNLFVITNTGENVMAP